MWAALVIVGLALIGGGCGGGGSEGGNAQEFGAILGHVTLPGGEPAAGIVVVAEKVENGLTPTVSQALRRRSREPLESAPGYHVTQTEADGSYQFNNLPVGTYVVSTQKPSVGAAVQRNVTVRRRETTVVNLELTPTGRIAGTVTVAGRDDHSFLIVAILGTSYLALTAADGSYVMSDVPVGTYTVSALDPETGRRGEAPNVTVTAGQTTAGVDFEIGGGPQRTDNLVARRLEVAPADIGDPDADVWQKADYYQVDVTNDEGSTGQVYKGEFNMTKSKLGIGPITVTMKAAYVPGQDVYFLLEWDDPSGVNDLNRRRWFYDVPSLFPPDGFIPGFNEVTRPSAGWTVNLNDDKFGLMFDIDGQAATDGVENLVLSQPATFAQKGCAVACHEALGMGVPIGQVDIWHWKTSRSNPQGLVNDQRSGVFGGVTKGRGTDAGTATETQNFRGDKKTGGPDQVWDGTEQFLVTAGGSGNLDPANFLLSGHTKPLEGDVARGDALYKANCLRCHQADGKGMGRDFTSPNMARKTPAELFDKLKTGSMKAYMPGAPNPSDSDVQDVVARLYGFFGVPGYVLGVPAAGESSGDLVVLNSVPGAPGDGVYRNGRYRVVVRRRLNTGHEDDVQFDPTKSYTFGLAIMDGDGKNHAGKWVNTLQFAP